MGRSAGHGAPPGNRARQRSRGWCRRRRARSPPGGRAAWQGEPALIALAETRAAAEDALELAEIDWQELPCAVGLERALAPGALAVHPGLAHNIAWSKETIGGDPDAAFAAAALVVETNLRLARLTGVALEPRGLVADWNPAEGVLTVHYSHQMQAHLAEFLGLAADRVRVVIPDVGGGFGVKMHVYPDEIAAIAAAVKLGRPVKFVADRLESLGSDIHAREHAVRPGMALDAEGRILAFDVDHRHGAIEGATESGRLARLPEAFYQRAALQCGFCTPGMLLVAAELLERNPSPSRQEIREALSGNLCRCTGYQAIVDAVEAAAAAVKS